MFRTSALSISMGCKALLADRSGEARTVSAEVLNIVARQEGIRQMVLSSPGLPEITQTYDLREPGIGELIADAIEMGLVGPRASSASSG